MTHPPLISFITVTYQAASMLSPTLDRLLAQSSTSFECLVIDGGSNDGTVDVITTYATRFQEKGIPFRWISEPDKGLYDAMNKGLVMAEGSYVWFMNAGDRLASEDTLHLLEKGLKEAGKELMDHEQEQLPDFMYGETMIVDATYGIVGPRRLKAPTNLTWKHFRWGMLVCHQAMLVKRTMAPPFNTSYRFSSDYDWAIRCLKASRHIHNTGLVLCEFMEGGLTKQKMSLSLKERYAIMAKNYGYVSTTLLHGWFFIRAAWFKLQHGWM